MSIFTVELTVELECRVCSTDFDFDIYMYFCCWAGMSSWFNEYWSKHMYRYIYCWAGGWAEMSNWLNGLWFWHTYVSLLLSWPLSLNVEQSQRTLIETYVWVFLLLSWPLSWNVELALRTLIETYVWVFLLLSWRLSWNVKLAKRTLTCLRIFAVVVAVELECRAGSTRLVLSWMSIFERWAKFRDPCTSVSKLFATGILAACQRKFRTRYFNRLSLIHHLKTVPNLKKLQTTTETWLLKDFKIQIA